MNVEQFCSASRVVIVAGKGGVGKTTVTAALATTAARAGASVLIVEVEGKSGLAATLGIPPLTYEEQPVGDRLRARTLTPDEALLEYLEEHGLRRISRRLLRSGALDVVATAVPGMRDILVLGKVKALERAEAADLIVIDAPAAGHAVNFLLSHTRAPRRGADGAGARPGRGRHRAAGGPGPLPGDAGHAARGDARQRARRHGLRVGGPGRCEAGTGGRERRAAALDLDGHDAREDAAAAGVPLSAGRAAALDAAATFRLDRRTLALAQADRLARELPLPQLALPFLFGEIGPDEVATLADTLAGEIRALPS